MDRILLVSEDEKLKKDLASRLSDLGFHMRLAVAGEQASTAVWQDHPDLILFEYSRGSHAIQGFCKELREDEQTHGIPVVALIQEKDTDGFDLWEWVEDFIMLPCRSEEMKLRIRQAQRKKGLKLSGEHLHIGSLTLDLAAYEVLVRGVPVALTYREYELLKFLATHPNRVFNRNTLLQKVWRYEAFVGTRTVDIHIRRLRSKLGDVGSGIQTVRNVGYKFNLESRV